MWTITLYDAKVPHSLCHLQKWFAKAIVEPLDRESCLKNYVAHDADQYVFPSTALNPRQRIELYSQQYWWRLLGALHKSFPLTVRLLGYSTFNQQIAQPYLVKFPSTHWSLSSLGCQLPKWIREEYQGDQKELLEQAVAVDWGFDAGFIAAQWELKEVIALQPHVHLLSLSWDLIAYRKILKQKAVDEWKELPPLDPQPGFWVLYRNQRNHMAWVAITESEYTLLKVLTTPHTVDQFCAHIETYPQKVQQEVAEHLQEWFEKWGKNRWLGTPPQDL